MPGTVVLGIAMLALLVPLMEGRALGWPLWTLLLLVLFPFALSMFVMIERRIERAGRTPLLPPSVMRLPSMRRGMAVAAPFFLGFGGFMFVYAVTMQAGLGFGPFGSGAVLTPMAVSFFVASLVSARLVARLGARVIPYGAVLQAVGLLGMIVATRAAWPNLTLLNLAPGMLAAGFGQGMMVTALFRVILSRVPADRAGIGSGSLATMQQSSLALGVATLGTLFLSLSATSVGLRDAFVVVMSIQVVIALYIVLFGRSLPDPR